MTTQLLYFLLFMLVLSFHARPMLLLPRSDVGKLYGQWPTPATYWVYYTFLTFIVSAAIVLTVIGVTAVITPLTFRSLVADWRVLLTAAGLAALANGLLSYKCAREDADSALLRSNPFNEDEFGRSTAIAGIVIGGLGVLVGMISLFGIPFFIWFYHLCRYIHLHLGPVR